MPWRPGTPFWVLLAFVVLGELRPVVHSGRTDPHGVILATAFVFATLLYWGLELALVAVLVATVVGELARRKALYRLVFNVAQYTCRTPQRPRCWGFGWDPSVAEPASMTPAGLLPFAAAGLAYHLANILVVGTAIGCADGSRQTVREAVLDDFGYYAWTTGAVLALSPLVVVVLDVHWGLLPLLLWPLHLLWQTAAMSVERETRALHDDLTGLGNRALLLQRLAEHVDAGRPVAVCLLDLDRFKEVNDTLGHGTGDQLLRLVADRLRAGIRPADTVARLGGDEFVLLLEVDTFEEATGIVDRLVAQLRRPYEVAGARLEVGASAGIAMFPEHGDDLEVLLRRADAAMYAAKEASSSTVLFTDDLEHVAPSRLELLADLRRGIRDGELVVHYQPQVRVEDGVPVRLEALVRWHHPTQGLLAPAQFLPAVERTNVMRAVTAEVLEQVLAQLASWGTRRCRSRSTSRCTTSPTATSPRASSTGSSVTASAVAAVPRADRAGAGRRPRPDRRDAARPARGGARARDRRLRGRVRVADPAAAPPRERGEDRPVLRPPVRGASRGPRHRHRDRRPRPRPRVAVRRRGGRDDGDARGAPDARVRRGPGLPRRAPDASDEALAWCVARSHRGDRGPDGGRTSRRPGRVGWSRQGRRRTTGSLRHRPSAPHLEAPAVALSSDEVRHVATLARLALSDDEVAALAPQLSQILAYAEQVGEVAADDVPPTTHPFALRNVTRPDVRRPSLSREAVLASAPAVEDDRFAVPRIVAEEG
jgi:aspartyl/glutamyl-tRNA(Asn/Gln) amidotransferase C subunit